MAIPFEIPAECEAKSRQPPNNQRQENNRQINVLHIDNELLVQAFYEAMLAYSHAHPVRLPSSSSNSTANSTASTPRNRFNSQTYSDAELSDPYEAFYNSKYSTEALPKTSNSVETKENEKKSGKLIGIVISAFKFLKDSLK